MKSTTYVPNIIRLELEHRPKHANKITVSQLLDQWHSWAQSPVKTEEAVAIKKHHKTIKKHSSTD